MSARSRGSAGGARHSPLLSRRALLVGLGLGVGFDPGAERSAAARGRVAQGGRASLRVPWPLASLDPHDGASFAAALFADAVFDTLYARDARGAFGPSLAEAEPAVVGDEARVVIRGGLRSARGRTLGARECAASIARARAGHARGWLSSVPAPRVSGDTLRFVFAPGAPLLRDPAALVRVLASPLVAIVPPGFSPDSPDGTGPFRATLRGDGLTLTRNPSAARGPAFLDELVVRRAADLKDSLRAFESGADELGWLGMGLYDSRPGARPFDLGPIAYAALFVGRDAGSWDAPGLPQRICDSIPPSRLAPFALGPAWPVEPSDGWGGPSGPLLVRDDSPYLLELATTVAGVLSRPGHELTVRGVSAEELAQRRTSRLFTLALDLVRPAGHGAFGALVGLTQAVDPTRTAALVTHPPRLADLPARTLTRTLRCGVLGEIRAQGGRVPDLSPAAGTLGVDWGETSRARR